MTQDEEVYLALGRDVAKMIFDVQHCHSEGAHAYARRNLMFEIKGQKGTAILILVNNSALADQMEAGVFEQFNEKPDTAVVEQEKGAKN